MLTLPERAAFRARTRLLFLAIALVGGGLTALAVAFKPPLVGSAALLVVLGGALWVAWRYLQALRFSRDPAPPPSL